MYQAIFFDMDETLLMMDEKKFLEEYLRRVAEFFEVKMPGQGKRAAKIVATGGEMLRKPHPGVTNEQFFWDFLEQNSEWKRVELEPLFLQFYQEEFGKIEAAQKADRTIIEIVETLVQKGYPLIIATNPMLPEPANKHRVVWAGLEHIPWLDVTGYEHYCSCKPDPQYFLEICDRFGYQPEQCLMIGNSMIEDMGAKEAGLDFYLLLDQVKGGNPEDYAGSKGKKEDLLRFVQAL